jgi:hypothetical protein
VSQPARLTCPHCGEALELAVRTVSTGAPVDRDRELCALVLAFVAEHGPVSQRQARSAAGVAGVKADAVIQELQNEGLIRDVGNGRARAWITCPDAPGPLSPTEPVDTPDTRSDTAVNGRSGRAGATTTLEAAQTDTAHEFVGGECPDPTSCQHRGRHATGPWSCAHNHPREAS